MKKTFIPFALFLFAFTEISYSQNMGISDDGTSFTPASTSVLELKSTSRGVLVPRMTTVQRTGIGSPSTGLMVYDTDTKSFWYYDVTWKEVVSTYNNNSTTSSLIQDANKTTKVETEKNADEDKIRLSTTSTERMVIDNTGITQIGTPGSNYTQIDSDGSLSFQGTATMFDDLTVSATSAKSGSNNPTWATYKSCGLWFYPDGSDVKELFATVQLPHGWKVGSTIYPHIHWVGAVGQTTAKVTWAIDYTWANLNATFSAATTISAYNTTDNASDVIAHMQKITALPSISGAGKTLSSVLLIRIYRLGTDVNDTYGQDAGIIQIDFHIEKDTEGSRTEYVK